MDLKLYITYIITMSDIEIEPNIEPNVEPNVEQNFSSQFRDLQDTLGAFRSQITTIQQKVRTLERFVKLMMMK